MKFKVENEDLETILEGDFDTLASEVYSVLLYLVQAQKREIQGKNVWNLWNLRLFAKEE